MLQLKSSLKYSTNICKQCFKELISSLEFQQKIINNQARLHFYEDEATELKFEDIKEEPELDVMPEIKTECFEFGSLVTQTWIEDEHSQSRNEAATLFEFEDSSILDSKTPPDREASQRSAGLGLACFFVGFQPLIFGLAWLQAERLILASFGFQPSQAKPSQLAYDWLMNFRFLS